MSSTLILEFVGAKLVEQADAASLLEQVEQHTFAFEGDPFQGRVELNAAVAARRAEDIAGEALGVDPDQDRFFRVDLAHDQGHVLLAVDRVAVGVDPKISELGGQFGSGHVLDEFLGLHSVGDEIGDGGQTQTVLSGEGHQPRQPGHLPVVIHDLAEHGGRGETRHPRHVDSGFGVTGAFENPAAARAQGEHVAGPPEIPGTGGRVSQDANGLGAIVRGNAGCGVLGGFDADGERSLVRRGVLFDHEREFEFVAPLRGHGDADEAAAEPRHEIDGLRGDHVGGEDEVPLVFAVFIIDNEDLLATTDPPNGLFGRDENIAYDFQELVSHFALLVTLAEVVINGSAVRRALASAP